MRIAIGLSAVMLVIAGAMIHADNEQEQKISLSDCPQAVQQTLKNEAKDGRIIDVDVRTINGVKIYESEVWYDDAEYDLVIRADGRLLSKHFEGQAGNDDEDEDDDDDGDDDDGDDDDGDDDDGDDDDGDDDGDDDDEMETRVRLKDLPKAVRRTLRREARRGEIEEIIMEHEDGEVLYLAEVEFGEKEYEVEIAWDGTLLSKVLREEDEEEDDDRDENDEDDDDD